MEGFFCCLCFSELDSNFTISSNREERFESNAADCNFKKTFKLRHDIYMVWQSTDGHQSFNRPSTESGGISEYFHQ